MIEIKDSRARKMVLNLRMAVVVVLIGSMLPLSACEDKPTEQGIEQHALESRHSLDAVMAESPAKHYNPLVVTDKVYAGGTALRMQRGLPLPARYETPRGIALVSAEPMSLADIANAITNQTGVVVHVTQPGGSSAPSGSQTPGMPVAYEGPLSGLLDRAAGFFAVNWHYDGASIDISKYETRVFTIEALPGAETVTEGLQGAQAGTSSGASASANATQTTSLTQTSSLNVNIKYWEELGQVLTSMLAGNGTVVMAPSLGNVTVTTTPEIMHSIAQYIAQENERLSRQIAINIEIYIVSLENGLDFTVAFNTLLKRLTNFGANLAGAGAPTTISGFTGTGALSTAILNPNTVGQVTDVFAALEGLGNTTTVAKFPLVTLNNHPVSRRIGQQISYVASSALTTAGTSGSVTATITPGTVPEGFVVQVTPRLLDDGRILLEYSLSDTSLITIKTFNSQCGDITLGIPSASGCVLSNSTSVQSPDTVERDFVQQSVLKSGSTLILGGSEEEDLSQNAQGVGDPNFYALGGGISSNRTHTMIFFAVTPQVLDTPHTEQE